MTRAVLFVTCVYFLSIVLDPFVQSAPFGFDVLFGDSICDLIDCCEDDSEENGTDTTQVTPQPPGVVPGISQPSMNVSGNVTTSTTSAIKYFLLFLAILINFDIILCSVSRNKLLNNLENYDDLEKIDCSSSEEVCKKEYSELEEIFSNAKQYNKRAFYESINNKAPCQCEMTYRLMDLGRTVYPRYVHSGVCKKKSCGVLLRCKPKKYKIRILKRKDFEVDIPLEDHDSLMPESLAEDWISDYVNIVIGCECVPVKV